MGGVCDWGYGLGEYPGNAGLGHVEGGRAGEVGREADTREGC